MANHRVTFLPQDVAVEVPTGALIGAAALRAGLALACQTVVEGDLVITVPEQAEIQRRLVTEHTARKIEVPFPYDPSVHQTLRTLQVLLLEPPIQDSVDDLTPLRRRGESWRRAEWTPGVALDAPEGTGSPPRLTLLSDEPIRPVGLAVD